MRAAYIEAPGGPSSLVVAERQAPTRADGVLIDVEAAGVGHMDLVALRGEHQMRPDFPFIPGHEVAGTVRDAPPGSDLVVGTRVAAFVDSGGFAELAVARPEVTMKLPDGLSAAEGAAMPVNFLTSAYALMSRARTLPGEVVIVHGAGGGLGMAAVRVARLLGAEVFAVVSDAERAANVPRVTAGVVVGIEDWVSRLRDMLSAAGHRWANVVFDPVGGNRLAESARVLGPEGRLVSVGFAGGIPSVAANRLLVRNLDLIAADWLPDAPVTSGRLMPWLAAQLEAGAIRPPVTHRAPLRDAAKTLSALAGGELKGKAVLEIRSEGD